MRVPTRLATTDDLDELIRHRAGMFEELGVDGHREPAWRGAMRDLLQDGLGDAFVAVVVPSPDGDRLVASGTMCLLRRMPHPRNLSGSFAYVQSMWTDPDARRQGHARAVLRGILEECGRRGIVKVELHASPAGAHLYESHGFTWRTWNPEMEITLAP